MSSEKAGCLGIVLRVFPRVAFGFIIGAGAGLLLTAVIHMSVTPMADGGSNIVGFSMMAVIALSDSVRKCSGLMRVGPRTDSGQSTGGGTPKG